MDDFVSQIGRFTDLTYALQASEAILMAAIASVLVTGWWWGFARSSGVSLLTLLLISITTALLTSLAIGNITITLFGIAAIFAFGRGIAKEGRESLYAMLAAAIGIGIGSGYYFLTAVFAAAGAAAAFAAKVLGLEGTALKERMIQIEFPGTLSPQEVGAKVFEGNVASYSLVAAGTKNNGKTIEATYLLKFSRGSDPEKLLENLRLEFAEEVKAMVRNVAVTH